MKISVLNGSPKGDQSATMQYVYYIQKKFPQHEIKIFNVAQQIKILEKNQEKFHSIIEEIETSDGVIWGFPLYVMLVSSQYKRFIELITERNVEEAFKNKYTIQIATSIHFYDHTAINYINAICNDLEMNYVGFFSAEMFDLMVKKEREKLVKFADNFFYTIENKLPTSRQFPPIKHREFDYLPKTIDFEKEKISTKGKKVLIISDSMDNQTNLGKMIQRLHDCFVEEIEVIDIYNIDIKGGCLGCMQCGYDNQCIYKDKDEFMEFWSKKLQSADILIVAGTIKDRYLSSRWKMVFDRSFFNGHIPTLTEKQIGFLISGPLGQIANLRQILQAYIELQNSNLVDIITDEYENSKEIDLLIYNFAKRLIKFSNSNYILPRTFLYVGGNKIFRDAIYGRMRFIFQADHRFYEKHGYYDFPQNDKRAKRMNEKFIPLIENNEGFRKKFYSRAKDEMIKPLKSIVADPNY
ncbi:MAG: NAD(P)H-dependent oxidoreductase [Promethearchaeota archaeon]